MMINSDQSHWHSVEGGLNSEVEVIQRWPLDKDSCQNLLSYFPDVRKPAARGSSIWAPETPDTGM